MRRLWAHVAGTACIVVFYLLLPCLPLVASLVFWCRRYVLHYGQTLRKIHIHLQAMNRGPALHYFQDVQGRLKQVPQDIQGECVQCGNCCMDHQCMFLDRVDDKRFQCGIYNSPLRRFSNCGSFPINAYDIERYACPGYFTEGRKSAAVQTEQYIAAADIRRAPAKPATQ